MVDIQFDKQSIQKVVITYDPEQTSPETIVEAIESRGDRIAKVVTLN